MSISALLNATDEIYRQRPDAASRPIKGYPQIVNIFLYIVAIIPMPLRNTTGERPTNCDTTWIRRHPAHLRRHHPFVASIQLSMNDTVRLGDWIEMGAWRTMQARRCRRSYPLMSIVPVEEAGAIVQGAIRWRESTGG